MRRHTETANEPEPRLASLKVAAETVAGPPPAGQTFQSDFFIVLLDSVIQRDFSRVEQMSLHCVVKIWSRHCFTTARLSSSPFSNFHCLHLASPHSFSKLSTVTTVTETKICAMWRILCQFQAVFGDLLFRPKLERTRNAKNSWRTETGTGTSTNFFLFYFLFRFPFAVLHGERSGQSGAVHHQHGRHS